MGTDTYYMDDAATVLNSIKFNAAEAIQIIKNTCANVIDVNGKSSKLPAVLQLLKNSTQFNQKTLS